MILTVQKARGDSTDADLGQVIDMPAVCAMIGVHDPDRAEGPWRFHRCGSWACPLFSTTNAHGLDRRRRPWRFHSCRSRTCPLLSTTGAHGPDRAEALGDAAVALYRQIRRHPCFKVQTSRRRRSFHSYSTSTKWSMSLLCWSSWFHRFRP